MTVHATNDCLDPSCESGVSGAQASGSANLYPITYVTGAAHTGATCVRTDRTTNTLNTIIGAVNLTPPNNSHALKVAVSPGESISGAYYLKCSDPGFRARCVLLFRDTANINLATVNGTIYTGLALDTWARIACDAPAVAPANTAFVILQAICYKISGQNVVGGEQAFFDSAMVNRGDAAPNPFFYGDTPDTVDYTYSWEGTPHQSRSLESLAVAPIPPLPVPEFVTCNLLIDGARVPDTPAEYAAGPVALDGLSVTWGRESSDQQPEPATCSFRLFDAKGGAGIPSVVHAGSDVQVAASGPVAMRAKNNLLTNANLATWDANKGAYDANAKGYLEPVETVAAMREYATPGNGVWYVRLGGTDPTRAQGVAILPLPVGDPAWQWYPNWETLPSLTITGSRISGTSNPFAIRLYAYDPATNTATATSRLGQIWTAASVATAETFTGPFTAAEFAGKKPCFGLELQPTGTPPWTQPTATIPWNNAEYKNLNMTWADWANNWGWIQPKTMTTTVDLTGGRAVPVFTGRVTDLELTTDEPGTVTAACTAVDSQAELGHRYIGDEPWVAETAALRASRIASLATIPLSALPTTKGAWVVSWRDVDNASSIELLQGLASTVDCILWARMDTGATTLYFEDPSARTPLLQLAYVSGVVVIVENPNQPATIALSACDVLAEPTVFRQDTENIVSIVDVTWLEQTTDPDTGQPAPTERHYVVSDDEAISLYGTRRLGITTELTTLANAQTVGDTSLARQREAQWLIPSLEFDTGTAEPSAPEALSLLDARTRVAAPLAISELPDWSPIGSDLVCWIEGGQYGYTAGFWDLVMRVAPATSGGKSVTWANVAASNTLKTSKWAEYDPAIDWRDLVGVGAPTS